MTPKVSFISRNNNNNNNNRLTANVQSNANTVTNTNVNNGNQINVMVPPLNPWGMSRFVSSKNYRHQIRYIIPVWLYNQNMIEYDN